MNKTKSLAGLYGVLAATKSVLLDFQSSFIWFERLLLLLLLIKIIIS